MTCSNHIEYDTFLKYCGNNEFSNDTSVSPTMNIAGVSPTCLAFKIGTFGWVLGVYNQTFIHIDPSEKNCTEVSYEGIVFANCSQSAAEVLVNECLEVCNVNEAIIANNVTGPLFGVHLSATAYQPSPAFDLTFCTFQTQSEIGNMSCLSSSMAQLAKFYTNATITVALEMNMSGIDWFVFILMLLLPVIALGLSTLLGKIVSSRAGFWHFRGSLDPETSEKLDSFCFFSDFAALPLSLLVPQSLAPKSSILTMASLVLISSVDFTITTSAVTHVLALISYIAFAGFTLANDPNVLTIASASLYLSLSAFSIFSDYALKSMNSYVLLGVLTLFLGACGTAVLSMTVAGFCLSSTVQSIVGYTAVVCLLPLFPAYFNFYYFIICCCKKLSPTLRKMSIYFVLPCTVVTSVMVTASITGVGMLLDHSEAADKIISFVPLMAFSSLAVSSYTSGRYMKVREALNKSAESIGKKTLDENAANGNTTNLPLDLSTKRVDAETSE